MSSILNGIKEAKRSPEPDYNDPSWDEKVSNVGQKAKQAQALKAKGKEPRTRWNPETKKYYVDFSDDEKKVEEGVDLSTDQIQQIFKGAQDIETSSGTNRSLIGKAKDLMTKNQPQSTTPTVRQYSNNPTSRPTTTPTSGLSAIAPKRATAKPGEINGLPMRESVELTESQIYRLIGKIVERQKQVDEGVLDWAKTKGQNLTNKITADKLLQAWRNAGSKTDSDEVAKIMVGAGVPQETVNNLMKNFVQGPTTSTTNPDVFQGVDRSIPPAQRKTQAGTTIPSAATSAPGSTPMPAGWRPSDATPGGPIATDTPTTTTTTNIPRGPIGKKAGIQAINQAVATVKKVKSNVRPAVAKYGEEQFDKISLGGQEFKPGDPMYDKMRAAAERAKATTNESVGLPYPGTYEETNDMFKSSGQRRIGSLTTEDEQIDGMAQGEIREIIKNAIHIKNQLDKGVSLDGWMYSFVTVSNDKLNSVAEQINNPNIEEQGVAEGSDELYQKAIRKYVQQVAHDYLGGGNAHLYGANKFDSEMFGVSQEQAKQDFKTLFPQALKQLQGVAEGLEQTPDQVQQTLNAWMNQDQSMNADPTQRASFQAKVWPYIEQNIKTILADRGEDGKGSYPAAPYAAWLLVQHMDAYPQNQGKFLQQLTQSGLNPTDGKDGVGKLQFLKDRYEVNKWILQNANNKEYFINNKPLPNPTVNVRNPAWFKDAGIIWTSRQQALEKAIEAGNKLLVAAVQETDAQTQPSYKSNVAEGQHSCPHCGGEMVSEELMNEKKDACYYKVKSRYKVWPSAYASGALVKCRKSHGSWGNGGKKNESSILEGIERADENLHQWFKEKWVRFGPDGKIRGDCARGDDSEGKPKCLPQSKAQNLGKKGRASAAARKRREDPNPERSGKAINVNTKKK